jgi:putative tryptophan/tyrosine transport system substrate-binding protein
MRRRELITLISSAALAWPLAARAQKQAIPMIGFLNGESQEKYGAFAEAFRKGLSEAGLVEGRNVSVEYRWAQQQYDRLPALARDLVDRGAAVIAASGGDGATYAVRAATTKIPIVFLISADPVKSGVVASLNRPGGNITGFTLFLNDLMPKRLELLLELLPKAATFAFLTNPNSPISEPQGQELKAAALIKGLAPVAIVKAGSEQEISAAFTTLIQLRVDAVVVEADSYFQNQRDQLVALAARHGVPMMFHSREFVARGGLMSYGTSIPDIYRQVGIYAGEIAKGAKPANLPVLQPTKFDLVINLKTAKALGIIVPATLLTLADEVIE